MLLASTPPGVFIRWLLKRELEFGVANFRIE
jgi:hypothetical protein